MKVFFSSPIQGIDSVEKYIRAIDIQLKDLGYKNIDNLIERLNDGDYYETLNKGCKKAHEDFFAKTISGIKLADLTMFECTIPSLGIGFQVEKSIEYNKPTVILYLKDNLPHFISGIQSDKLLVYEYEADNLSSVINKAIVAARQVTDKRFNFFISPSLLTYLEEESTKQGITKSAFIRQLILEHKKKKKS